MAHPTPQPPSTRGHSGPSRALRWAIPVLVVLAWLAAMGVGGPIFGKISDVTSNSQADFLPADAPATEVSNRIGDFSDAEGVPAIIVAESHEKLTRGQQRGLSSAAEDLTDVEGVSRVSPAIRSEDDRAVQIIALVDEDTDTATAVEEIRSFLDANTPAGVTTLVSGPAGLVADLSGAFAGIDGLLLVVALVAVFLILILVYRSPVLPVVVLLTSVAALCGAIVLIYHLARSGAIALSGQTQGILSIVVIGAATDYGLLYTARFREALHETSSRWVATQRAWKGTLPAILASGTTVIAGLLCLWFSLLTSNRALGPVTAIGVVFAMLAGLTLLPALLALVGRVAFWPRIPKPSDEQGAAPTSPRASSSDALGTPVRPAPWAQARSTPAPEAGKGLWPAVARLVDRRSRAVWLACVVVLGAAAAGATQLQADGVPESEFVLGESESRDGLAAIERHFPGGAGDPVYVLADVEHAHDVARHLDGDPDVDSVAFTSTDSPSGTLPYPAPEAGPLARAEPTEDRGQVLIQATLTHSSDSVQAQDSVRRLREDLAAIDPQARVGGTTAVQVDTIAAAQRDRAVIIPLTLVVILFILVVLLRSILMPLLLVATTVLSYFSALGIATGIFAVLGINQADPTVPLFGFVFLVALGIDYNIFLMTRVREEVLHVGHRAGVLKGLVTTGGVITSAGIVLAATFAALGVLPILFLVQLAIIVSVGVLLDTVVVRSLLVPALTLDIGPASWWPSRIDETSHTPRTSRTG